MNEETAKQSLEKGKEYIKAGQFGAAVIELRYALRLQPTLGDAQKLLDQAEKEAMKAPTAQAVQVTAQGQQVQAPKNEGDVPEEMKKAMESHYIRGKQFYDLGQYKRAEVEFQLVVELNRAFKQVVELLEKCKSKLSDYIANKLVEARQAKAKGQLVKEIAALKDALDQDPTNTVVQAALNEAQTKIPEAKKKLHLKALDFYAQDKIQEAVNLWEEARDLDPEDEMIKRSLDRARQRLISIKQGNIGGK